MKLVMQREKPGPEHAAERRAAMIEAADGFDAEIGFTYPSWFDGTRG
jgi:hypothetical protein